MCFLSAAESVLILPMWFHVCFYVALYAAKTQLPFGEKMKLNSDLISWDTELLSGEETESSAPSKKNHISVCEISEVKRCCHAELCRFSPWIKAPGIRNWNLHLCFSWDVVGLGIISYNRYFSNQQNEPHKTAASSPNNFSRASELWLCFITNMSSLPPPSILPLISPLTSISSPGSPWKQERTGT